MEKRDLKADLEWVRKATKVAQNAPSQALNRRLEHAFVEKAREGWPHAIERALKAERALGNETILNGKALAKLNERALKAESLARELVEVIDELRRQIDECGLDSEMWDTYERAKEVLGDE